MTAQHDDLDLTSEEDRPIYRMRVAQEFRHMRFTFLKELAEKARRREVAVAFVQGGVPPVRSRAEACREIADIRIRLLRAGKELWV